MGLFIHSRADRRRTDSEPLRSQGTRGRLCALTLTLLMATPSVVGAQKLWDGGSGNWDTAVNWNGDALPISTDNVFIIPNTAVTVSGPTSATTVLSLTLDNSNASTTILNLGAGALTVSNDLVISQVGDAELNSGTGTLNVGGDTFINAGGTLSVASGGTYNPTGTVNLDGGMFSVDSLGSPTLDWTTGTLEVTGAGGLAVNLNGPLGGNPVTIDTGKTLSVTNTLQVNSAVNFTVDGGTVSAGALTAFIGAINANSGSINAGTFTNTGTVNLAGATVTVHTFDASAVAPSFTDGTLTIDGGSYIPFAGSNDFTLSGEPGTPTLRLINGATMALSTAGTFNIALGANENAILNVWSGSSVTSGNADAGGISFLSDAIVNVDGAGSSWDITGFLDLGHGNDAGQAANAGRDQLNVSNDADVTVSGVVTLGTTGRVALSGGQITAGGWVRNASSQFSHTGGTLRIDGGDFQSGTTNYTLNGAGRPVVELVNAATHSGVNIDILKAEWNVLSDSTVTSTTLDIYNNGAGDPGKLTVDGTSSSWTNSGLAQIGLNINGEGDVVVSNGGSVSVGQLLLGSSVDSTGTIDVSGAGSEFRITSTSASSAIGFSGTGTVDVSAGGSFTTPNDLYIGFDVGGSQGTVTIRGTGSNFEVGADNAGNNDSLVVSQSGTGTLDILDGATARIERLVISNDTGPGIGTGAVTVDSENTPGASLEVNGDTYVGSAGKGTLTLSDGAMLETSTSGNFPVYIGFTSTADGSAVDVNNSAWNHLGTGLIAVGNSSNSNTDVASSLTIQNGGAVTASGSIMLVADQASSTGNLVVKNLGSTLTVGRLLMGDNGAGTATISNGASVVVSGSAGGNLEVSAFGGGSGIMTVTDPGTTVTVADYLSVGDEGTADGDLTIDNGASVSTTTGNIFIARTAATSQGLIVVQDLDESDGSTLTSGNDLIVGGNASASGGTGQLDVNTGGTVDVTGSLSVWYNGTVNLNGGTIKSNDLQLANSVSAPFSTVNWASGTFRFKGDRNVNVETLDDLLGTAPTLVAGQELQIANVATLSAPLRLNGGTLTVGSVLNNNFSNVSFDAGTFNLTSANLTVGAGGLFGSSLLIESDQTINVTSQAAINAGAEMVVAGGFSSNQLTNNGELIAIDTAIGGPVVNNNNVTVVGTVDFNGIVSGPGNFFGPGTANFNGGMAPGASPAKVSFEGDVLLADTNTLFIEIGGTTLGDDYDSLTIAGDAALDGLLDVSLVGFSPTPGQQFTVLTANNIVNNGLALGGAAASSFSMLVGGTSVILQALAPGLPGDYNDDGKVDAADYAVWRKNEGTNNVLPNNPIPGTIGAAQYNQWRANFGAPGGAGAGFGGAVPEPTTSAYLLCMTAALLSAALRRRRPWPAT